jgi:glycolate oxidase
VVPRTKLPYMLRKIREIGEKHAVKIANVFHAGDGNLHPTMLFDERDPAQVKSVLAASHEILEECIVQGGSVTGEHGIGVEKIDLMPKMFSPEDLAMMTRLRVAFNPSGLCNPDKMLPSGGSCVEGHKRMKGGAS